MDSRLSSDIRAEHLIDEGSSSSRSQLRDACQTEGHLLRIPLELRLQIYENIFSDHDDAGRTNASSVYGEGMRNCVRARVQPPKHLSVAMTSKQVYREALPILYKTYRFRLSAWDDVAPHTPYIDFNKQLLDQLRRPSAAPMWPLVSCLDIFVDLEFPAYSEDLSSALGLINHSFVGLKTFCLHMGLMPCNWTDSDKNAASARKQDSMLSSLRGLANRVRIFKIDVWPHEPEPCYTSFLEEVIPESTWYSTCDKDQVSWICQGIEGKKSMVFGKKR